MAKKILTNLDLNKNELQNAVIQPLASAPLNPVLGQIYYNSTDKLLYQYDGTSWVAGGAVLSVNSKTGVVTLDKSDIGLGNVDNTSDANKPISTAAQAAFDAKLALAGGTMTGALAMGSNKITGLADGTADGDAVTLRQLNDAKVGALKPSGSILFSELPALSANVLNNIYNISESFTTTADFVEGAGTTYPAGTNVAIIDVSTTSTPSYKYDAYTGVIDTSDFLTKSGLASTTGSSTTNTMTQAAITTYLGDKQNNLTFDNTPTANSSNPVTSDGIKEYIDGLIKTATGTIGTSATSASVSYTGTLIATHAYMGGEEVIVDKAITSSAVTFSTASAPSAAITCAVIYV